MKIAFLSTMFPFRGGIAQFNALLYRALEEKNEVKANSKYIYKQIKEIDPESGKHVLTELFLLKQGNCCGSDCRHCPYGHINVVSYDASVTNKNS